MSHPGISATRWLITSGFVWPHVNRDAGQWTKECLSCQHNKVNRHTLTPHSTFAPPSACFDSIHLDFVGPLPHSNGYTYLLTVIDRFTRWPEAFPLPDIRTETIARAFLQGWIARFGTLTTLTTDRGGQFQSDLWNNLMIALGSHRLRTNSYHLQFNGLIERLHCHLKAALKCHQPQHQWTDALQWVLLGIRSAVKEVVSSHACTKPVTDSSTYAECLRSTMSTLSPIACRPPPSTSTHPSSALCSCTHIFIRRDTVNKPLQSPYDRPFWVIHRTPKYYQLEMYNKLDTVSVDELKPAHMNIQSSDSPTVQTSHSASTPQSSTSSAFASSSLTSSSSEFSPPNQPVVTRSGRQVRFPQHHRLNIVTGRGVM